MIAPWFGRVLGVVVAVLLILLAVLYLATTVLAATYQGKATYRYCAEYKRYTAYRWANGPTGMLIGQGDQESGLNPNATSPYAKGLAQFTNATADWAAKKWSDLANPNPYDWRWSIRAQVRYMEWLFERHKDAATECDQAAFSLAGYNGGDGYNKRRKHRAREAGYDPARWFGHAEKFCRRAAWACLENNHYPRVILFNRQYKYTRWGRTVTCEGVHR